MAAATTTSEFLPIAIYGNEALDWVTKPVIDFGVYLKSLTEKMFKTMYRAQGIGLAANQVASDSRLFIMDVSEGQDPSKRKVFINPQLVETSGAQDSMLEGCLSFPAWKILKHRPTRAVMRAHDVEGNFFEYVGEGVEARCMQHELEHLDGHTLATGLSSLKLDLMRRKVKKYAPLGGFRLL